MRLVIKGRNTKRRLKQEKKEGPWDWSWGDKDRGQWDRAWEGKYKERDLRQEEKVNEIGYSGQYWKEGYWNKRKNKGNFLLRGEMRRKRLNL